LRDYDTFKIHKKRTFYGPIIEKCSNKIIECKDDGMGGVSLAASFPDVAWEL
jgi:hypothetical protein